MKKIVFEIAVFVALAIFSTFFATHVILPGEEKYECQKWQKYARESPEVFQPNTWQKKQCDRYGIIINAPVKKTEHGNRNN